MSGALGFSRYFNSISIGPSLPRVRRCLNRPLLSQARRSPTVKLSATKANTSTKLDFPLPLGLPRRRIAVSFFVIAHPVGSGSFSRVMTQYGEWSDVAPKLPSIIILTHIDQSFCFLLLRSIPSNKFSTVNIRLTLPRIERGKARDDILYKKKAKSESKVFQCFRRICLWSACSVF